MNRLPWLTGPCRAGLWRGYLHYRPATVAARLLFFLEGGSNLDHVQHSSGRFWHQLNIGSLIPLLFKINSRDHSWIILPREGCGCTRAPPLQWTPEENNPKWGLAVRTGLLVQLASSTFRRREPAWLVVSCPGPPVWLSSRHAHPTGCHRAHTHQPGEHVYRSSDHRANRVVCPHLTPESLSNECSTLS